MATIVAVSAAGLFAWGTFVRLWRGDEADRVLNRASVSNLANTKFGTFGQFYDAAGLVGLAAPVLVVVVLVVYARGAHARSWGTEVRTWLWAYPTYVMAGSGVAPVMLRYLLPAFPLVLIVVGSPEPGTTPRRKVWLVIVCCLVGIALQWWWIDTLLIVRQQQNTPWMP